jgi:four helix bundle protein
MVMGKGFEDLEVWKLSVQLSTDIYKITESFPKTEQFGLTNQIRRSVVSIPSNLAEGSAKNSKPEFARFISMSQGSNAELKTQLIIAKNIGFLQESDYINLIEKIDSIARMLKALRNSIKE